MDIDKAASDAASAALYRKILWRIMPLIVICYIVSFIDRTNVGVAKIQFMADLGFTNAQYGAGAGIFYLGYVLLEIPSNQYLAKVGIRKTLLRIMVIWGICCGLLAVMSTPIHYYVLRFMLGAAEAGLFPGILLYLTYWVPTQRRAQFTAIFMASIPIAGLLGGPLAGWIMTAFDGAAGLRGWQWVFITEGAPAVLLGVVAYLYFDDKPNDSKWLTSDEKAAVLHDLESEAANRSEKAHASFRDVLRDGRFYALGALGFGIMVSTGGIFFWLPTIINHSGIDSVLNIGLLSALPFAVAIVMQYLVARHSDKAQERRLHAVIPALIGAVGWAVLPSVADNTVLAMIALTLATTGTLGAMGPFWSLPPTMLSGAATAGGIALITTLAGIGNFFSPILVGWLVDLTGSLATGQYYFAALLTLGGLVVAYVGRPPAPKLVTQYEK